MKTTGFTRDFLTHAAFLAKAVHRGEHTCPQGFFLIDNPSIQKSPETGSGFQAQVYVNPELRQVWVVMAGTNEWVDMLAWPTIEMGYSPSNPFLSVQYIDDAVCFAETVQNVVEDNEAYKAYQVNVAGYSLAELCPRYSAKHLVGQGYLLMDRVEERLSRPHTTL